MVRGCVDHLTWLHGMHNAFVYRESSFLRRVTGTRKLGNASSSRIGEAFVRHIQSYNRKITNTTNTEYFRISLVVSVANHECSKWFVNDEIHQFTHRRNVGYRSFLSLPLFLSLSHSLARSQDNADRDFLLPSSFCATSVGTPGDEFVSFRLYVAHAALARFEKA